MNPNKPFGLGDKVGYALGDFGNDFTFMLSTMFLMKFYTDVMGVSAALVGLMMMLCRFIDAFRWDRSSTAARPGKTASSVPGFCA